MNRIYLLLLSLVVGFAASADNFSACYIKGSFNGSGTGNFGDPLSMSKNSKGEWYIENVKIENGDNPQFLFYTVASDGSITYYGSNGNTMGTGEYILTSASTGSNIYTEYKEGEVYSFYLNIDGHTQDGQVVYNRLWVEKGTSSGDTGTVVSGYYFYGDMNRWSISGEGLDHDKAVTIKDGSGNVIANNLWENDVNSTQYCTEKELNDNWQLIETSAPTGIDGVSNTGKWYYLDFANLADDQGNIGRLCGQFKITCGDHGVNNWAIKSDTSDEEGLQAYLKCKIVPNTVFGESGDIASQIGFTQGSGLQNFQLDCSYVDNAKLYFNPDAMQVVVTGEPKYIYAYYAVYDGTTNTAAAAPKNWAIADLSQVNYYANSRGFNDGAGGLTDDSAFNPDNFYNWDAVENVEHNGISYGKVYRRLIPYGATHRYPIAFNIKVTDSKGDWFAKQLVACEDLWFIESSVNINIYFRYADNRNLSWVGYNIFGKDRDDSGVVNSYRFAYGDALSGSASAAANNNSKWVAAEKQGPDTDGNTWWKSQVPVPDGFYSGVYAIFHVSDKTYWPADGVNTANSILVKGELKGNDLYYIASDVQDDLQILYSHLKNTVSLSSHGDHTLQINAELFDSDGNLDVTYGDENTKYKFEVMADGNYVINSEWQSEPYCDLNLSEIDRACTLQVTVTAKKNGSEIIATDTYPIFE